MIMPELPAWLDEELLKVGAPQAAIGQIKAQAIHYLNEKSGASPPAAELSKDIGKLENATMELVALLKTSEPALEELVAAAAAMSGRPSSLEELQGALTKFLQTLRFADANLIFKENGRPVARTTQLAEVVAEILESHGIEANDKTSGPLYGILTVLFRAVGERNRTGVRGVARRGLDRLMVERGRG